MTAALVPSEGARDGSVPDPFPSVPVFSPGLQVTFPPQASVATPPRHRRAPVVLGWGPLQGPLFNPMTSSKTFPPREGYILRYWVLGFPNMNLRGGHNSAFTGANPKTWSCLFSVSGTPPRVLFPDKWPLSVGGAGPYPAQQRGETSLGLQLPFLCLFLSTPHLFTKKPDYLSCKSSQILDLANCISMLSFHMFFCIS